MIEDESETNLAQMTEAVLEDGYAIVQEFVDGGEDGDARIFLLEGQILERDGKLAAFRRVPTGNDPRPTSALADARFLLRSVTWNAASSMR
jgi:glutathione synthase